MTREDAWRKAKGYLYDALTGDEADEIIKALEQEEDCVNRKAAIIQLSHNKIGDDDCDVIIQKDIETIKALPPATPQPATSQQKVGRWILSGGYWRCSECKEKALLKLDKAKGNYKEYMPIRSNFCPNCGIKMEV